MGSVREQQLSEQKRLLGNPYAFLEEIEEMKAVHAARKLSENPHAHIEYLTQDAGPESRQKVHSLARATSQQRKAKRPRSSTEIERLATDLQRSIWKQRHKLFDDADSMSAVEMLQPAAALRLIGYDFEIADALGQLFESDRPIEAAGLIDSRAKKVLVSGRYPPTVRHFTGAHELGHAVMHDFHGMHRDKPLEGVVQQRELSEVEADKFAAFFLMPRKLLRKEFERRFGKAPFSLNEDTEFALWGSMASASDSMPKSHRQLARLLASTPRFNGTNIVPLSVLFGVSVEAMAIRLEELGLLVWSQGSAR